MSTPVRRSLGAALLVLLAAAPSANAASIAVFGANSNSQVVSFLNTNGHTAVDQNGAQPTAGNLAGVDAVIALRNATFNQALADFVSGGGLLITEWNSAEPALDTFNMLNADGGSNAFIGSNTPITVTAAGLAKGLGTGLSNPFADGPRTEFQWTLSNIGVGVEVLGFYGANTPAIIGGAFGAGYVVVNSLDWADSFPSGSSVSGQFLLNELAIDGQQVPEPVATALLGLGLVAVLRRRQSR